MSIYKLPLTLAVGGLATLGGLAPTLSAQSGNCIVHDINRTLANGVSSSPSPSRAFTGGFSETSFVRMNKHWYFTAKTGAHGVELWRTDGSAAGTTLVKDIRPGSSSSSPSYLIVARSSTGKQTLFFRATDSKSGSELWKSDGTANGTVLVADLRSGSGGSFPVLLETMQERVYFSARVGSSGYELWSSDGTSAGTKMIKDIAAGSRSSSPRDARRNSAGTEIYFVADDGRNGRELWKTDGTTAGTVLLKDLYPGMSTGFPPRVHSSNPRYFLNHNGKTIFTATTQLGTELFVTDGTAAGTKLLKDIFAGPISSSPRLWESAQATIGKDLYFAANDGIVGTELWKTDGTTDGTKRVVDIVSGGGWSLPGGFARLNDTTLVFSAIDAYRTGREIWKTDGTAKGTVLIKDLEPGYGHSNPIGFTRVAGKLAFTTSRTNDIWITDGTPNGTKLLRDLPGSGSAAFTAIDGGTLVFAVDDRGQHGRELWTTRGTPGSTRLLKDLEPLRPTQSSRAEGESWSWGETVYLWAEDGVAGREPRIVRDGKVSLLKDITPGTKGSLGYGFGITTEPFQSYWFTRKENGRNVGEAAVVFGTSLALWKTDGTMRGTVMLKDVRTSGGRVNLHGKMFFGGSDVQHGTELWVSDGSTKGTKMFVDLAKGTASARPSSFTVLRDRFVFTATDSKHGSELWASDGTVAGTQLVRDIRSGPASSSANTFVACGDQVFFRANDGVHGHELWVTDGTANGTGMVLDIRPGSSSSSPSRMICCGDRVFFTANDGTNGTELWVSDGTKAGTKLIDVATGRSSLGFLTNLVCYRDKVYFLAWANRRYGLHVSDGTKSGTKTFGPSLNSPPPPPPPIGPRPAQGYLTVVGDRMYFPWNDRTQVGTEPWVSDGTTAGTKLLCDVNPGLVSSFPRDFVGAGDSLYFLASTQRYGDALVQVRRHAASSRTLGVGAAPSYSRLTASAPVLGATTRLDGKRGPTGSVGVTLLNGSRVAPVLIPPANAAFVDLAGALVVGVSAKSSFTQQLKIPSDTRLHGVRVNVQTWWVNTQNGTVHTSNGVHLVVGK